MKQQASKPAAVQKDTNMKSCDQAEVGESNRLFDSTPKYHSALELAGALHDPVQPIFSIEEMDLIIYETVKQRHDQ